MSHWQLQAELALAKRLKLWFARQTQQDAATAAQVAQLYTFGAADTPPTQRSAIPKIIWSYWGGTQIPLLVQKCMRAWKDWHPDYQVHVLDAHGIHDFVDAKDIPAGLSAETEQKKADWLRLQLLCQYGGIWLDASTILTQKLDWMQQAQQQHHADMVGFYLQRFTRNPQYPVVENWVMAAPARNPFIQAVTEEFTQRVMTTSNRRYMHHLQTLGVYDAVRQGIDGPEYLSMHLAIQHVLQCAHARYRLALLRAEDTAFLFQQRAGWGRARLKANLLLKKAPDAIPAIVKLRGPDRRKLDDYLRAGIYSGESIVGRYLMNANLKSGAG